MLILFVNNDVVCCKNHRQANETQSTVVSNPRFKDSSWNMYLNMYNNKRYVHELQLYWDNFDANDIVLYIELKSVCSVTEKVEQVQ